MFKLSKKSSFEKVVKTNILNDKGGYTSATFTVVYNRMSQSEIDSLIDEISARPDPQNADEERKTDIIYAKRLMVGFGKDICDEAGEQLEFNDTNLQAFLDEPGVASAVVKTFFDTIGGLRVKN